MNRVNLGELVRCETGRMWHEMVLQVEAEKNSEGNQPTSGVKESSISRRLHAQFPIAYSRPAGKTFTGSTGAIFSTFDTELIRLTKNLFTLLY